MATFTYSAQKADGTTYHKTVEAADRFAVYALIRKEGGTVIDIEEEGSERGLAALAHYRMPKLFGAVKEREKIVFARNLSTMIAAGLSLSRALAALSRQTRNREFKEILVDIEAEITTGQTLHTALSKHPKVFSSLFIFMVKAGEEGGRLVDALSVVARQMERSHQLKKKIRGALIYPSIVVGAMIAIGILLLIYVVPTLTQTFTELGVELPHSTQIVIGISQFMTTHTLAFFGIVIAVVVGVMYGFKTRQGRRAFEWAILRVPVISGIVKQVNAARTARTLSSLLSSGVEIVHATEITRDVVQNSYYKAVLTEAGAEIQKGGSIASVFAAHEDLYPVMVSEMVAVGNETGKLTDMLIQVADYFEEEVEQKTKDLSTVIEPFLMLFIGAVVGFFAVSMITPIYSISSGI